MMPPYPEKALFVGRHFMFAPHGCRAQMTGSGTPHTLFRGSAGPGRLLIIRKSTIPRTRTNTSADNPLLAEWRQPIPPGNPVSQPNARTAYLADPNFIMARRFGRRWPCSDGAHILSCSRAGAWFYASSSYQIAGRRRRPGPARYTRARSNASRARPRTASRPGGRPRKPSRLRAPQPVPRR
jgi:hypothetical protein